MIRIIAGGKRNDKEFETLIFEYQKRVRKPFDFKFEFLDEEKLIDYLERWPFSGREFVILCDERGEILSSPGFAEKLEKNFNSGREVAIIIGGAYGFSEEIRKRANFLWSFSKLVFPHQIARLIVAEQLYRAQEILRGGKYHHE